MHRALRKLLPFFILVGLLACWQLAVTKAKNRYMKATVPEVAVELVNKAGEYLREGRITLVEALAGFVAGNAVAFVLAVWMSRSAVAERLLYPYAVAVKATPVVALAPVLVTLLGMDYGAKVTAAALVSFFPLLVQLPSALRRVPKELVEMFRAYGASEWNVFLRLRLKACSPEIFSALKTSSTLSVVGAVVGEFISPGAGVGKLIIQAQARAEAPQLYAATFVAAGVGILLFFAVHIVQSLVVRWDPETI